MVPFSTRVESPRTKRTDLYASGAVVILAVAARFPFFFPDAISWDEGTQILMGQSILNGQLPYVGLWDNKAAQRMLADTHQKEYQLVKTIEGRQIYRRSTAPDSTNP